MSIFTKDCPVCAASHPVTVARCGCGYCFNPDKLDGVTQELEVISQEETLYRDYLAARAEQAAKAWHVARNVAASDSGNTVKAAQALLAEQTAMAARAELEAQDQRARAVKNRIKVVRSNRHARKALAGTPRSNPISAKPVSVRDALVPKPTLASRPPMPTHVAPPLPPLVETTPPVQVVRQDPPKPKVMPMANLAPAERVAPANTPAPPRPVPQARASATPPAPAIGDAPTPSFRASQATKAEQITAAPARPTAQECPNCSANVPLNVRRCRCGFEMPNPSQIPSLAMSPEDRAAFLAALAPTRRDRNR